MSEAAHSRAPGRLQVDDDDNDDNDNDYNDQGDELQELHPG